MLPEDEWRTSREGYSNNEGINYALPPKFRRLLEKRNQYLNNSGLNLEGGSVAGLTAEDEVILFPWERRYDLGTAKAFLESLKAFLMPIRYFKRTTSLYSSDAFRYWVYSEIFRISILFCAALLLVVFLKGNLDMFSIPFMPICIVIAVILALPLSLLLIMLRIMLETGISWFTFSVLGESLPYKDILAVYYYMIGSANFVKVLPQVITSLLILYTIKTTTDAPITATISLLPLFGIYFSVELLVAILSVVFFSWLLKVSLKVSIWKSVIAYIIPTIIFAFLYIIFNH